MSLEQKRYLITHTDLDGIGCAILYSKCYPNVEYICVDYKEVEGAVLSIIENDAFSPIMITDMSVNDVLANLLNGRGNVELVDHHPTAAFLNEYLWALVKVDQCATKSLYDILSKKFELRDYLPFVELVNNYDTWGGGNGPNNEAKDLNQLLEIMGQEAFFNRFIGSSSIKFTDIDSTLMAVRERQCKEYVLDSINNVIVQKSPEGFLFGIVSAEQFINETCHAILEHYPTLEYVMAVNFRDSKASLRGRGTVHVGELAQSVGGGGHKKAAGFPLADGALLSSIFICGNGNDCPVVQKLREELFHVPKVDATRLGLEGPSDSPARKDDGDNIVSIKPKRKPKKK